MHTIAARLRSEVIEQWETVAQRRAEWGILFRQAAARTPFQSPEWLLGWMEVFSPAKLRVVTVWAQDRLVGLAPLLIYARDSESVLAFAGGGVSDYLDLIAERGKESAVREAVFSAVLEDRS